MPFQGVKPVLDSIGLTLSSCALQEAALHLQPQDRPRPEMRQAAWLLKELLTIRDRLDNKGNTTD